MSWRHIMHAKGVLCRIIFVTNWYVLNTHIDELCTVKLHSYDFFQRDLVGPKTKTMLRRMMGDSQTPLSQIHNSQIIVFRYFIIHFHIWAGQNWRLKYSKNLNGAMACDLKQSPVLIFFHKLNPICSKLPTYCASNCD